MSRPRSSLLALVLALACQPACQTTSTVLREDASVVQLRLSSDPAGAAVVVDDARKGSTPLHLELAVKRYERRYVRREWKTAWVNLITGALATGGGLAATVWGFNGLGGSYSDPDHTGRIVAATCGILATLYGGIALGAGVYGVIAYRPRTVVELEPAVYGLRLEQAGAFPAEARVRLDGASAPLPAALSAHYSSTAQAWRTSGATAGVSLERISAPAWPDLSRLLALRAKPQPRPRPAATRRAAPATAPAPAPPDPGLLQELRQQGEACYRRRDYRCAVARFERALALAPTPAMRFNLASAQDKLGLAAVAVRQYRRYLEEAGRGASSTAIAHIQKRMKQLLPRVSRLQLVVGADVRVTVDGIAIGSLDPTALGAGKLEVVLEPGSYRVDVVRAGSAPRSLEVDLRAGALRTLDVGP